MATQHSKISVITCELQCRERFDLSTSSDCHLKCSSLTSLRRNGPIAIRRPQSAKKNDDKWLTGSWKLGQLCGRWYDWSTEEKAHSPAEFKRFRVVDIRYRVIFWRSACAGSCGVCRWRSMVSSSNEMGLLSESPHFDANSFLLLWVSSSSRRWYNKRIVTWLKWAWLTISKSAFPRSF